ELVMLNDVVEHALSFCEHVLDSSKAVVERDLGSGLAPIRAVRDQMLQVLINLVTNASDSLSKRGGHIRIRTWAGTDATVALAISDDGEGIKDDDRPHVFEP